MTLNLFVKKRKGEGGKKESENFKMRVYTTKT